VFEDLVHFGKQLEIDLSNRSAIRPT